jgi:hypothetical protein
MFNSVASRDSRDRTQNGILRGITMNELNELAAALAAAQGEIMPAPKDADNPYFKSKYASLPAVREAMRVAFAKHGLSVIQMPFVEGTQLKLRTLLLHSSGQSLDCGTLAADVDIANPQKTGSAISYFRRYSLAAVSQTVSDTDDDAQAASQPAKSHAEKRQLTGHDVVHLQGAINAAATVEALSELLKGALYQQLKQAGPADVYEQTSKLAKAKHVLLTTPIDEQPIVDEPKSF